MQGSPNNVVTDITNAAADRVLTVGTVSDEQQDLNAEANLSFDGSTLAVTGAITSTTTATVGTDLTVTGGDATLGAAGNTTATTISTVTNTGSYVGKSLTVAAGSTATGSANLNGGDLILKSGGGDGTGTSLMTFFTKVNGTDAATESMRIHTDANVGIGDDAPGTLLQLKGTAPYLTLKNSTAENTEGGCESRIIGEDHADNTLGQLEISHSGPSDDFKGKITLGTNSGSGLTTALTINELQSCTFSGATVITTDIDGGFDALTLRNQSDANDTTGMVNLKFDLEDTGGNTVDAAMIQVLKEAAMTATASTQDATMKFFTSLNGTITEGMKLDSTSSITVGGSASLKEKASANADVATHGQLWVKDASPNELYFTTGDGDDIQITTGTGTAGGGGAAVSNDGSTLIAVQCFA